MSSKVLTSALLLTLLVSCQTNKVMPTNQKSEPTIYKSNIHKGIFKSSKNQLSEICPVLKKGQTLEFKLTATLPVLFNFHFHENYQTSYPIPERNLTEIEHLYVAPSDNTYCLMWTTNLDHTKVTYQYTIR